MAIALSPSMVSAMLAEAADQQGVTPQWLAEQKEVLSELGLDPTTVTQSIVNRASGMFRKAIDLVVAPYNPLPTAPYSSSIAIALDCPPAPEEPMAEAKPKAPNKGKRFRATLFGHSITAVLRALGKEGWVYDDAWFFCGDSRVGAAGISKNTVKLQLWDGKTGKGNFGDPAPLTKKQLAWCKNILE